MPPTKANSSSAQLPVHHRGQLPFHGPDSFASEETEDSEEELIPDEGECDRPDTHPSSLYGGRDAHGLAFYH